ncbi:hypothetical protein IMCC3317_27620 [Kordia antarctica]|uniref:Uncharacterized protein n=1 Tax=Kordia antarctica TaxID=1218801 RepID=A0A7L4ZKY1_9FLAO|nr:hypothetical protein [Kordia antarctica]QHI37383.1 hypothetical protein IMCC3317_27620 [Kordia antarctica]
MKYFILLCASLFIACSEKQEVNSLTIADNFVNHFFISDLHDLTAINAYMTSEYKRHYNFLSEEQRNVHEEYIRAMIDRLREELAENNHAYTLEKLEELYIEEFQKEILYKGTGDVFLLKSNDEFFGIIIVEGNKIYSFAGDLYLSPRGKILPYFFFKELNAQRIEADLTFMSITFSSLYGATDERYKSLVREIDSTLQNFDKEDGNVKLCRQFKKLQKHSLLRSPFIFLNIEKDSVITVYVSESAYEKVKHFKHADLYKEKKKVIVQLDIVEKEKGIFYAARIIEANKVDGRSRSNIHH